MVPHTLPIDAFSHCAFTTKARRLPELLAETGLFDRIITYGVDGYPVEDAEHFPLMHESQWQFLFGEQHRDPTALVGNQASTEHPGYILFNEQLANVWKTFVAPGDVVCYPFGHAHSAATPGYAAVAHQVVSVETGIGYPSPFLPFRIYESQAWQHYVAGRTGCEGSDYHFVAPASYSSRDGWHPLNAEDIDRDRDLDVVYMGRLQDDKGMAVLREAARAMPDIRFHLYGQGNPEPYLRENVTYGGVLHGGQRRAVWARARAGLFMSRYIEPFSQAHVEALLTGVPVVGSDFGIYPESARRMDAVINSRSNAVMTARTLDEVVSGLRYQLTAPPTRRIEIAWAAKRAYGITAVAKTYRAIILSLLTVTEGSGWYTGHDHLLRPDP
jgi:glycosyltransferase involved in cell wall biosynthesis